MLHIFPPWTYPDTSQIQGLWEMIRMYKNKLEVRFEVLTAASMKMTIFWVVVLCSLVEVYRRFRGVATSITTLMMEAASTSKMLVNFYQTALRNNPEDSHLQQIRRFIAIKFTNLSWHL
jgi:hypothetical protein